MEGPWSAWYIQHVDVAGGLEVAALAAQPDRVLPAVLLPVSLQTWYFGTFRRAIQFIYGK